MSHQRRNGVTPGAGLEQHRRGQLHPTLVKEMRLRFAAGKSITEVAEEYELKRDVVFELIRGRSYKWAPGPIFPWGTRPASRTLPAPGQSWGNPNPEDDVYVEHPDVAERLRRHGRGGSDPSPD